MKDSKKIEHESFGVLKLSKITSNLDTRLFGSSVNVQDLIRLEISPAIYERHLHSDWIYSTSIPHIQVNMTQAQFAQAITSLNSGSGTPVTIVSKDGKSIEGFEEESKFEQFEEEFSKDLEELQETILHAQRDIDELINKKSVTKADREMIKSHMNFIQRQLLANIPFLYKSFNEQVGKTLHEAKMEIEAFSQQREVENRVKLQLEMGKMK